MIQAIRHRFRVWRSRRREVRKDRERSHLWPALRAALIRQQPRCEACRGEDELQVHHVFPFHLRPDLELARANLLVLCMGPFECHFRIGHGGSWDGWNPAVREHAGMFTTSAPEQTWAAARATRKTI